MKPSKVIELDTDDYRIIAIHSSRKEDFKVVYSINTILQFFLERQHSDILIETEEGNARFSIFEYEDQDLHVLWKLVSNKAFILPDTDLISPLFTGRNHAITKQGYLVPELKNVDYLIKIEDADDSLDLSKIIEKLNTVKIFSTAYELKQETIKYRKNLIF